MRFILSVWAFLVLAAALPVAPAYGQAAAAAAGAVDMTMVLLDERGAPLTDMLQRSQEDPGCGHCGPLTLGRAIWNTLVSDYAEEHGLDGVVKYGRKKLGDQLLDAKAAPLSHNQVALIERLVGYRYPPLIVAQVIKAIDPDFTPPDVR